ncbi:MAG: flagellar export chaperone FlgN [Synergistaceae bacterium]|nr:flagellar export chaperone FlgN [Synergistaceae bacterium]MBQ7069318.1 flagellar export chaperone FlgN [Synergistaceae bacterium]MBR0076693.1 flagellar export chaperone FlgN [Synergistaceae bacterium]MBR0080485.1 flagellar export chaperone FlgN [Synergistaceae bacterium]MBR0233069.1 flagellar export chaperone FlgN [Synergistaceae bacterium]
MRTEVEKLINAILDESDCIEDLIDAMREQREAMQARDTEAVNELMNETRDISFEVQSCENLRNDIAKKLAAEFSCDPKISSLASKLTDDEERKKFNGAAEKLRQSVFVLKSEIMILNGLIDQNEKYTSMLLSEWRRLNGDSISQTGSADFRG